MELAGKTLGFIGAGAMAESIVLGLLKSNTLKSGSIIVSDTDQGRLNYFKDKFSVDGFDNLSLVEKADIVVLAVKPKVLPDALSVVAGSFRAEQLLISIAAGISTSRIEELAGQDVAVVRVMPNTPSLVNAGASALCAGSHADGEQLDTARVIFDSVGKTVLVPETLMDAVTGLSGSGPAYIFMVIESLIDGAVRIGLPGDIARVLAAQTVLGAAQLVLESGEHPAILKEKVTTPGGTTAAGLYALEKGGTRRAFIEAVAEAAQRSQELNKMR
ncbi:MAG TPA: pyrroline-5-carboxylate reductase [Clostridia bacterium]|nr:pyrroline-5-carboxylate reductase [Clostridia bacterium]